MNLPGLLYWFAISLFCFQTLPATSGETSSLIGLFSIMLAPRKRYTRWMSSGLLTISCFAIGSFAIDELGCVGELHDADVLGVVGHSHPVERSLDLDVVAERGA